MAAELITAPEAEQDIAEAYAWYPVTTPNKKGGMRGIEKHISQEEVM
ncbi:MAG: hypothetical protein ACUVXI_19885 [bacterium]